MKRQYLLISILVILSDLTFAQNPIIRDQFSADPSARVFNGRVYLYPSHDVTAKEGQGRPGWFCMEDYHVFSSENLTEWIDHGVIVSQNAVSWADSASYSMWAPDCIERNGKYYFYFPATSNSITYNGRKVFSIGVAISEKPEGPFIPQKEPINGALGIDPNVFIDKDGQAYLIWAMGKIFIAKLKENMVELASDPQEIKELPDTGLKEGPWLFERNGIYYLTYPHVQNRIERLEYAIADDPSGPYRYTGVLMDESPLNCWTNHQSVIEYNGQWYLFYHQNAYSPKFDKNRSVCIDSLFFNNDGTIRKVIPTFRGVGVTNASEKIETDRYSSISKTGVAVELIDSLNTFKGWKTTLDGKNAWISYNAVDFGNRKVKHVQISALSERGGTVQVRLDSQEGPLISRIRIPKGGTWDINEDKVTRCLPGVHNLVLVSESDSHVEIDWIRFN
ncbi:MAG TPA: family 43 glycosylhydrolase [Bacteroidales bacterium]|nr:family 43 glycosylhydrolase [Bacteroidales bacterium]